MSIVSITALIFMFFIFLFIGIKFSKISKPKEFLLMGRNIGFWLFFGAYTGAAIGGASTAGFVGYGFTDGYSAMWLIAVSGITLPLFAFVFAKKINVFGRKNEAYTLPDFLAIRFGEKIRGLSSFISYLRPIFISGLQFVALGIVFKVAFGLNMKYGILNSTRNYLFGKTAIYDPEGIELQKVDNGETILTEIFVKDRLKSVRNFGLKGVTKNYEHFIENRNRLKSLIDKNY